ncbi:MAG TPA: Pvc16 family protein [Kofleriaceae bacterium]
MATNSQPSQQHHIIKDTSETLSRLMQDEFKRNGYKRVHIVEQAPKPDAIEGKLPAVSVYLYQMSLDPDGYNSNVHHEIVEEQQPDGSMVEYMRRRRLWIRLDYLVSAWAQTPEDEQLLLGLIVRTVLENPVLSGTQLKGHSFEQDYVMNLQLGERLDEGTLSRFWGSLNQPVRPAVQTWSMIPIVPEKLEQFKRVETRQLEYRSITDPRVREQGPSGHSLFSSKRLDLGGGSKK